MGIRIQRKLTKEGLAAELGISESTIKKYENGERALSITNLFKIRKKQVARKMVLEELEMKQNG